MDVIIGAKTKDMLILEDEMKAVPATIIRVQTTVHTAMQAWSRPWWKSWSTRVEIRPVRGHRPGDHDEIHLPAHKKLGIPTCQHEPDHGGRYWNVRRMPSAGGR